MISYKPSYKILRNILAVATLLISLQTVVAQEFNVQVSVNANNVAQPNQPIFKTLQNSIQEFYNNTQWTSQKYEESEKISCSIVFVVTEYDNDRFRGNFQISMSRPVFNSSYTSPTFNYKDDQIAFEYIEYAPLFYNSNQYENNLLSLLSFYAYTMLGIDGDTFALKGGQKHFEEAQRIVNLAQGSQIEGWRPSDGLISRYRLNDDILSDTYKEYREVLYGYHIKGMDQFADNQTDAKNEIKKQLTKFDALNSRRPNSLLQRVFFDAKAPEIASIFGAGPFMDLRDLKVLLQKLAPNQSATWRTIQ